MIRTTISTLLLAALLGACSSSSDPIDGSPDDGSGGGSGSGSGDGTDDGSGDGSSGGSSAGGEVVPGTLLEGVWESPCALASGTAGSRDLVLAVTERVFELNDSAYGDTDCRNAQQTLTTRGSVEEQPIEDGREPSDGIPIDLTVDMVFLKPLLSPVADEFNALALCGITNWVPEVEQDVSGCTEVDGGEAPRVDSDRYFVDDRGSRDDRSDDTLVFGTLGSGGDGSARPQALDTATVFTRRPGSP